MPLWLADEVRVIARSLIGEGLPHDRLMGKKIVYVFQKKMFKIGGALMLGKAEVVGGKAAAFERGLPAADCVLDESASFFLITIAHGAWVNLTEDQKRGLVDHELSHCGFTEKGNPMIWAHDLGEFRAVVERNGFYLDDIRKFAESCEVAAGVECQTKLDLTTAPDPPADPTPPEEDAVPPGLAEQTAREMLSVVDGGQAEAKADPAAVAVAAAVEKRAEAARKRGREPGSSDIVEWEIEARAELAKAEERVTMTAADRRARARSGMVSTPATAA